MHDQTEPEWLTNISSDDLGTGLFLLPQTGKVSVQDITYAQCKQQGQEKEAIAIKWVPHSVASFEALQNTSCNIF